MPCTLMATGELAFSAAPGERLVIFGDQHGRMDLFGLLHRQMRAIAERHGAITAVFLGDLIDRGPDSLGCLDLAISTKAMPGVKEVVAIAGNHEEMLYTALYGKSSAIRHAAGGCWAQNGGIQVMDQLGMPNTTAKLLRALGNSRTDWLREMTTSWRCGDLLFLHAGVCPSLGAEQLRQPVGADLTGHFAEHLSTRWVREPFLEATPPAAGWLDGSFVFHGHDPNDARRVTIEDSAERLCRINLDGGSYKTGRSRLAMVEGNRYAVYQATA